MHPMPNDVPPRFDATTPITSEDVRVAWIIKIDGGYLSEITPRPDWGPTTKCVQDASLADRFHSTHRAWDFAREHGYHRDHGSRAELVRVRVTTTFRMELLP